MGRRVHYDHTKVADIPKGTPFVMHSIELLSSDAWRSLTINALRMLNFLEIEHMNHGGAQNGYLMATYRQLHDFGINKKYIPQTIGELEDKGLIFVEHGARRRVNESYPNLYTLTYRKRCVIDRETNVKRYYPPSNDWKNYKKKKSSSDK